MNQQERRLEPPFSGKKILNVSLLDQEGAVRIVVDRSVRHVIHLTRRPALDADLPPAHVEAPDFLEVDRQDRPPSTDNICPETHDDGSLAKNSTALAISAAVPGRRVWVFSINRFWPSGP